MENPKVRFEHRVEFEPNLGAKIARGLPADATTVPEGDVLADEETDAVVYEVMIAGDGPDEHVIHWGNPIYRMTKAELLYRAKNGYPQD